MNRTVQTIGRAALVPVAIVAVRYAWKAMSPALADSMPLPGVSGMLQERLDALRRRLDRSGASEARATMLKHDRKALQHAKAGEVRKWQAMRAAMFGAPIVNRLGDRLSSVRSSMMGWQARREAGMARKHKAAAIKAGATAEKRKWQAISTWLGETGDILRRRAGDLRSLAESDRLQEASKRAKDAWAEYGWGQARAEREAAKRRSNMALGLAAGLGIGAGAAYLLARRKDEPGSGYGAGQAQHMYYTGNGTTTALQESQQVVDQAMRQTESNFDNTTAASGGAPARELGAGHERAEMAPRDASLDRMLHGEDAEKAGGEAWIVIPKEQWAEFIQRVSDSHRGWNVRVETEGNLSMDQTPVDEARFSGMQLEPSMARPGVRMFVGRLPQEFLEHVIPDLRTVEHLPSDEEGYQGVRLTTTVDRVTIRFTHPGEATDEAYRGA